MKANELMIGDWITMNGIPIQVTRLSIHGEYQNVEPIPVTSEIIEKNFPLEDNFGPKVNFHIGRTCELENGSELWIGKWHNGATLDEKEKTGVDPADGWWEIVYSEQPYLYECGMKVRFVHELQHALRLCGIEKEIVL